LRKRLTMKDGRCFADRHCNGSAGAVGFLLEPGYAYVNVDPHTQLVHANKRVNVVS